MTFNERKQQVKEYLGKTVNIIIDRPGGYIHSKATFSITYPVNYGFIPDVAGGDGEELDVYLLGVNEAVNEAVKAAASGETVFIKKGVYSERVEVLK